MLKFHLCPCGWLIWDFNPGEDPKFIALLFDLSTDSDFDSGNLALFGHLSVSGV